MVQYIKRKTLSILKNKKFYLSIALLLASQFIISLLLLNTEKKTIAVNITAFVLAIGLISYSIYIIQKKHNTLKKIGKIIPKVNGLRIGVSFIIMFSIVQYLNHLFVVWGVYQSQQHNETTLTLLTNQYPMVMIIVIGIMSPIVEELIFRELLPSVISRNKKIGFVIGSVLFVIMHIPSNILGVLSYSVLSYTFMHIRIKNNNIYGSIIAHSLWNTLSLIVLFV